MDNVPIESHLYSDDLFSFSVDVNRATQNSADQLLRTSRRTVNISMRNSAEVTIADELPPQTAKRITNNVKFRAAR